MKTRLICTYRLYPDRNIYDIEVIGETEQDAFIQLLAEVGSYLTSEEIEDNNMSVDEIVEKLITMNGDGCDFIMYLKNESTGDIYFDDEYEDDEEYDEEYDEEFDEDGEEYEDDEEY